MDFRIAMTHPCAALLLALPLLGGCADPQDGGAPVVIPPSREARAAIPTAPARSSEPSDAIEQRLLDAHNVERRRSGLQALVWSDDLEAEAQEWARELNASGRFEHDPRPHGHGENLWAGWGARPFTPEQMVGAWADEKASFRPGIFPNVSTTGDWLAVGHYTQMIWPGTTHVGCALDTKGDRAVLACRYSPPGNVDGQRVG